jgi:hypothetical protein
LLVHLIEILLKIGDKLGGGSLVVGQAEVEPTLNQPAIVGP